MHLEKDEAAAAAAAESVDPDVGCDCESIKGLEQGLECLRPCLSPVEVDALIFSDVHGHRSMQRNTCISAVPAGVAA